LHGHHYSRCPRQFEETGGSGSFLEIHFRRLTSEAASEYRHVGARSGSNHQFRMNNQLVTAFFNFTNQGTPTGFAGAIFYRDFLLIPGQYLFTFEGTHVADSPPQLINPILCADTCMVQWPGARRGTPRGPAEPVVTGQLAFGVAALQAIAYEFDSLIHRGLSIPGHGQAPPDRISHL
jgi:hypothetical protein